MGQASILRSIAEAAGRYGLEAELSADGGLSLRHQGGITIVGSNGKVKLTVDGERVLVEERSLLQRRRVKLPPDRPGLAVAVAYLLWMEANKGLRARLFSRLVTAGRRAGAREACARIIERLPGISYELGLCSRLASLIAFAAYQYRLITGVLLDTTALEGAAFPPEGSPEEVRRLLTGLISIVRSLSPGYSNLSEALDAGSRLFQEHGLLPKALKLGIDLTAWVDRVRRAWQVYMAALLAMKATARLAQQCRGPGLLEAVLDGEALWARSGDGLVACVQGTPLAALGALANYYRAGARVALLESGEGSVRCVTSGRPGCTETSIVVDPTPEGVRDAFSMALDEGYGVEIVYHDGRAVALSLCKRREGVELVNLGTGRLPFHMVPLQALEARRYRAKPRPVSKPEALLDFVAAHRMLVG